MSEPPIYKYRSGDTERARVQISNKQSFESEVQISNNKSFEFEVQVSNKKSSESEIHKKGKGGRVTENILIRLAYSEWMSERESSFRCLPGRESIASILHTVAQ